MRRNWVLAGVLLACGGCSTLPFTQVQDPKGITVPRAMTDIGDGISCLRAHLSPLEKGLYIDEIELNLDVSAEAKGSDNAKLTLSGTPATLVTGEVYGEAGSGLETVAKRGNSIKIVIKSEKVHDRNADGVSIKNIADPLTDLQMRILEQRCFEALAAPQ